MPKLIDQDDLNQGTEITFNTVDRTIQLIKAGNLSDDGVSIQCIYSFIKEEWKVDDALIRIPIPLKPIDGPSGTQFDLVDDWTWKDVTTTGLIRDGGWAQKDADGVSQEEWMNISTLGSFVSPDADTAYFTQGDISSPTDITLPGAVNQAIKIYGDASHGNFDYRKDFTIFLREEAKTYDEYDLITQQNISALTYKSYGVPLSNSSDSVKITHTDAEIAQAPYTNIDITYHATPVDRVIGGNTYKFSQIIEGDGKTLEQIYEKLQYLMRQTTDIDEGVGTVRGDTATTLCYFVGDTLYVTGFIDNIQASDSNRIVFIDNNDVERTNPFTASLAMNFNNALVNDPDSVYRLFFTNDNSGDDTGRDFGTDNAILVKDDVGNDVGGDVNGRSLITISYDYDGNTQRGAASAGTDAPVTLVGIGLSGGQYVAANGVISRSKSNSIGLVAGDELTYTNPV